MLPVDSNTDMITHFIGKDVFLSVDSNDKKNKLSVYEQCIKEIKERVELEDEVKVTNFWGGGK